jgi:hypothetical protein
MEANLTAVVRIGTDSFDMQELVLHRHCLTTCVWKGAAGQALHFRRLEQASLQSTRTSLDVKRNVSYEVVDIRPDNCDDRSVADEIVNGARLTMHSRFMQRRHDMTS